METTSDPSRLNERDLFVGENRTTVMNFLLFRERGVRSPPLENDMRRRINDLLEGPVVIDGYDSRQ